MIEYFFAALMLIMFLYVPGFVISKLFFEYKNIELHIVSVMISIFVSIMVGLILSLIGIFNLVNIIIIYLTLGVFLFIKWKYL